MLSIQEINIIKYKIKMLDIKDFKKKLDKKSRLMGIDPGKNELVLLYLTRIKQLLRPIKF